MAEMEQGSVLIPFPEGFLEQMKQMLGDAFPAFLRSYEDAPARAVRTRDGRFPFDAGENVPWEERGRYLPFFSRSGAEILHEAGAWYLQEASAMIPARVLAPEKGDKVLDLCAAPGGKSTQLSSLIGDGGLLVCNEYVPARAKILSSNVERMGCRNCVVVNAPPEKLSARWPGYFDRILVDAPCSGEGMFRRHPEARREWTASAPQACHERQLAILHEAAKMLRSGGRMVYSTCTFNSCENERTVERFLRDHPGFELVPFGVPGVGECEGMMHFYPHLMRGEGHFAALMQKTEGEEKPCAEGNWPRPERALLSMAEAFLREKMPSCPRPDGLFGTKMTVLPSFLPPLDGIRVLRAGLRVGEASGKVFLPDHALSHAIACEQTVPLTREQAFAYLRGESIPWDGSLKGFCVVSYDGCSLGFGKISDGQIKNHYPKGLRRDLSRGEENEE